MPFAHNPPDFLSDRGHLPVRGCLTACAAGVVAGTGPARAAAETLGLEVRSCLEPGTRVQVGTALLSVEGPAGAALAAADTLIGCCAKPSGIATAARWFVDRAGQRVGVVCGAWRKYPLAVKDLFRSAIAAGGAGIRMAHPPFLYLDKNHIRVLGGLPAARAVIARWAARPVVVQVAGEWLPLMEEALLAARAGASVVMVDTGSVADAARVAAGLVTAGLRPPVRVALGGGVNRDNFDQVLAAGVDLVDIGRAIIDAPLLDLRYSVHPHTRREEGHP